jgi:hypothetical protein
VPPEVLEARIALRVAELRLLAAWTACAAFNRRDPPPLPVLSFATSAVSQYGARWRSDCGRPLPGSPSRRKASGGTPA